MGRSLASVSIEARRFVPAYPLLAKRQVIGNNAPRVPQSAHIRVAGVWSVECHGVIHRSGYAHAAECGINRAAKRVSPLASLRSFSSRLRKSALTAVSGLQRRMVGHWSHFSGSPARYSTCVSLLLPPVTNPCHQYPSTPNSANVDTAMIFRSESGLPWQSLCCQRAGLRPAVPMPSWGCSTLIEDGYAVGRVREVVATLRFKPTPGHSKADSGLLH